MIGDAVPAAACGTGLAGRAVFALAAPKAGEARHRTPEIRKADESLNRMLLEPETQAMQDRKKSLRQVVRAGKRTARAKRLASHSMRRLCSEDETGNLMYRNLG